LKTKLKTTIIGTPQKTLVKVAKSAIAMEGEM
jgi:hypothetical protein